MSCHRQKPMRKAKGPKRIKLSRTGGFSLQKFSKMLNGLPAVNCARPGYFGNPFRIGVFTSREACVATFRNALLAGRLQKFPFPLSNDVGWKKHLRGKNLACWCELDEPCHCDVFLEIANAPRNAAEPDQKTTNS